MKKKEPSQKKKINKNIEKSKKNIEDQESKKIKELDTSKLKNHEVKQSDSIKDTKKLYELRETINGLSKCEQTEILKIIEKNDVKFTQNMNGIFINMNKLDEKTIKQIEEFLLYAQKNYDNNLI